MADVKTEQEPSIEEILESIRQIISDDAPAAEVAAAPAPAPQPAPPPPAPKPEPKKPAAEVVIDLTDRVDAPPVPEIDMQEAEVPQEEFVANTAEGLLSDQAADASAAAMARLFAGNVAVERDLPGRVGNVTLEDIVRDMMRPMVKSWLDQNMPRIVEKMVAKEVEKISRLAMKQ